MAKARTRQVALPAVVDLDALDSVRDGLLTALEGGPLTVSGEAVERISTNALLMLMSAAETAKRTGLPFAVTAPSAPMQAAIARLGFDGRFAEFGRG